MKVVRYRSAEGTRTALLVSEGVKYLHVIQVDYPLHMQKLPLIEGRYMTDMEYPVDKAKRVLRKAAKDWHGGLRGVSQEVRDAIRA